MKILISEGTWFIEIHLCRKLLNDGHQIICLDNNFTCLIKNISDILENSNFQFIEHNVINPIYLDIEQIYHLVWLSSPESYQYDSIKK